MALCLAALHCFSSTPTQYLAGVRAPTTLGAFTGVVPLCGRRYAGVGGTLDELFATDDPEPRSRLRELMALEERRRAMMRKAGGAQGQPVYPEHAQWRS